MTEREARAKMAWRNAAVAVALNLIGMVIEMGIARGVPGVPMWPALASMAAAAVMLAILVVRRHRPSMLLGNTVFLANAAVILVALWSMSEAFANTGRLWMPFQEFKLGMVTVAMIAPEAWVGAVGISAYALSSLAQLSTFDSQARAHMVMTEPWGTIAFGVFSAILLIYRMRQMEIEREYAVVCARIEATDHHARVLLAVRDLANTPVQTIAFAAEAARHMHPDVGPLMDRVDRSLGKLRALDRQLRAKADGVAWTRSEESLDAESLVAGAARLPDKGQRS